MDLSGYNSVLPSLAFITAVSTAWYSVQKIIREYRKIQKSKSEKILEEAQEYDKLIKEKLESKINILELEIHNLRDNVSKDLSSIKDSHALELKNLSDRIEMLRDDLRNQHSQLLSVLTKLVN